MLSGKMLMKLLADMAGITPDEIADNIEQFRTTALAGIQLLADINNRLDRIENHLDIHAPKPPAMISEIEKAE